MRLRELTLASALTAASLLTAYGAETQQIKAVFIRNGEIFTWDFSGKPAQITNDGIQKEHPLWSKDGSRIAYLQDIDKNSALAELVVISSGSGSKVADILIRPVQTGEGNDMRFIETLQWLTPNKIAASGSINPSTEESLVLDLNSGKELMNYYDDDGGTVYSPDGEHAAYINGAPHFAAHEETAPALNIDLNKTYPTAGFQVDFLSKATWNPDGTTVAIVARNRLSRAVNLVICPVASSCSQSALPAASTDEKFSLTWSADGLSVKTASASWSAQGASPEALRTSTQSSALDLKQQANTLVQGWRQKIVGIGGNSVDFWCADCVLTMLPRRTGDE